MIEKVNEYKNVHRLQKIKIQSIPLLLLKK